MEHNTNDRTAKGEAEVLWEKITTGITAGAVTFRWAQNTANPIPSTIERGSSFIVWE